MNIILFLDFDGVLHPYFLQNTDKHFMYINKLEKVLREYPKVNVVISSSWRINNSLEQLKQYFAPDIRNRIIGVTPEIKVSVFESRDGIREKEINLYLQENNLNNKWIALDDDKYSFTNREYLYECKDKFDEIDATKLSIRLFDLLNSNNKETIEVEVQNKKKLCV